VPGSGLFRAGSRDALREFVRRREVGRLELRVNGGGCSATSGGSLQATYGR
jgi:hypothetical protein